MEDIKIEIKSSENRFLIFDETTDSCDRYMLAILIGSCGTEEGVYQN